MEKLGESSTSEQVHDSERVAALHEIIELFLDVDPRYRNGRPDPDDEEDHDRKENTIYNLFILED